MKIIIVTDKKDNIQTVNGIIANVTVRIYSFEWVIFGGGAINCLGRMYRSHKNNNLKDI